MNEFPKPKIFISRCLGFEKCRYDGAVINDAIVEQIVPHVEVISACPEKEIGLGVPRKPVRLVKVDGLTHMYQPTTGADVTVKMQSYTTETLDKLGPVDGFILKHKSPSCGLNNVKLYPGFDNKGMPSKGAGLFGGEIMERFRGLAIEDEGRLKNFAIREYFLTKLFTLAAFRELKEKQASMKDLVAFHTRNKLLFIAHDQVKTKALGQIVANHGHLPMEKILENYQAALQDILSRAPSFTSWINVLMHAFGGVSDKLQKDERKFFLDTIEEYRDERIPMSVLIKLLHSWALRFDNGYLMDQSFMNPYPKALVEVTDSGKGRSY